VVNFNHRLRDSGRFLYKLPIFYLPTVDTPKSAEDRKVKEKEVEEEEEEEDEQ
jgi:hypothetical protein